MPTFFIGHGNPMNALLDNPFTQSLQLMGKNIKTRPNAILVISAHYLTSESYVTISEKPETIYDFYGFPDQLYIINYSAPGSPFYAKEVMKLIPNLKEDKNRGLDHGAWTILKHMFPKADIPVFQLSIDMNKSLSFHYNMGKNLAPLREKGVLIISSGNIVHNLRMYFQKGDLNPYPWAEEFDNTVKEKIEKREFESLTDYPSLSKYGKLANPTLDHYIPLLYTLGLYSQSEDIKFTYEEVESSMSMRCLKIG